jgi:DNA recombination protein RmuC
MLEGTFLAATVVSALALVLLASLVIGQVRLRERMADIAARLAEQHQQHQLTVRELGDTREMLERRLGEDRERLEAALGRQREAFDQRQLQALRTVHRTLQQGMVEVRRQVSEAVIQNADLVGRRVEGLSEIVDRRLGEIGGQVGSQLADGFERTSTTFSDVVKRLAHIDEAQRRIAELSNNMLSLQEILSDKRSRGALGEIQLAALIRNVLPESAFSLQHTLSSGVRVDCVVFLPSPTGNVVIDAKFPLESYRRLSDPDAPDGLRRVAERQFATDVRRHIRSIASKYLIPGETADGALMFVPAEAVFAEIHAHHPGVVEEAFRARVWLASPATLMAILTTARAVLRDEATRQQAHLIRQHLDRLGEDFARFRQRLENLARHVDMTNRDVQEVSASARRLTQRFQRIDDVQLENEENPPQDPPEAD